MQAQKRLTGVTRPDVPAQACTCRIMAASRVGVPTKCVTLCCSSARTSAAGLRARSGASATMRAPPSRGPRACQTESTNVGAVWKQTTSERRRGLKRCCHAQRFRMPASHTTVGVLGGHAHGRVDISGIVKLHMPLTNSSRKRGG